MVDSSKYVVLDVETNGLSSDVDDLLSITIYKPDDGKIYNKFLPLEKSRYVKTTQYNGITIETLKGATPLNQDEVDFIINEFDIKNKTILTYGNLDKRFLNEYFKRKKLKGFNSFNFLNYKEWIYSSAYQEGNITKDNLCKLYGIDNVTQVHSGENDCILEWKLFEKMNMNKLIVINNKVYKFDKSYVIPVTYVSQYRRLKRQLRLPSVAISVFPMMEKTLDKSLLTIFGAYVLGIALEHRFNSIFGAKAVDSSRELCDNISKLEYIGTLPSTRQEILIEKNDNGELRPLNENDKYYIDALNEASLLIKEKVEDFIKKIKKEIFNDEPVYSQELVLNQDYNLLALCDLSNDHAVVEVKTSYHKDFNSYALQLYVQASSRPIYLLYIDWENKTLNLGRVEFSFGDDASEILEKEKTERKKREKERLQTRYFDDKNLELVVYKGKTSVSEFVCLECESGFKVKRPLTHDNIQLMSCPYCNPNTFPRFDKRDNKPNGANQLYWETKKLEKVKVTNWVLKDEIYVKCLNCNHEWCDNITNVLKDSCPKCNP